MEGNDRNGFDQLIQEIMKNAFGDTKNRVYICVFACVPPSLKVNRGGIARCEGWKCIVGSDCIKRELDENVLVGELLLEKIVNLEPSKSFYISAKDRKNGVDSRITGMRGEVDLWWIALCDTEKTSYKILSEVILEDISARVQEVMFIERLEQWLRGKAKDEILASPWGKELFSNLLDEQWLFLKYVNKTLGMYKLPDWRLFVQISAMLYEKRIVSTKLFFEQDEGDSVDADTFCTKESRLSSMVDLGENDENIFILSYSNLRTVRKVMEMSGDKGGVLLKYLDGKEGYKIKGIIRVSESDDVPDLYIDIKDHMVWGMYKNQEEVFEYRKGEFVFPEIKKEQNYEEKLKKANKYMDLESEKLDKIVDIVRRVKGVSSHGAVLIFMSDNLLQDEMKRLVKHNRVYQIKTQPLGKDSEEILKGLVAIDGAIMLNFECRCIGVGAILDGKSCVKGKSERGSRYNSVANYINALEEWRDRGKEGKRIAVIISEDGMEDVVYPLLNYETC